MKNYYYYHWVENGNVDGHRSRIMGGPVSLYVKGSTS